MDLAEIKEYRKKSPYLTVKMVNFLTNEIDNKTEISKECWEVLNNTYTTSSPMWRQSHSYLEDYLKNNVR